MSRIVVIGESPRVDVYELAGALVVPVDDPGQARRAWDSLADDVEVVIVTPAVASAVADRRREGPIAVVMTP